MMVRIGRFDFKGPYDSPDDLDNLPGVFAVISVCEGKAELIDVSAAEEIRRGVEERDRQGSWRRADSGCRLIYAAAYTPLLDAQGRREIEQELRMQYRVPSGAI